MRPGRTTIYYTIPTPEDSPIGGGDSAAVWECAANGSNSLSETWRVNTASVKRVFPKWWSEGDCTANFSLGGSAVTSYRRTH